MSDADRNTADCGAVEHCARCPYRALGPAIGSRGDARSRLVLVGEAPGRTEIEEGRPFAGRAGQVLSSALRDAGLNEAGAFIINAVACRPMPVRPRRAAIAACHGRLVGEIELAPRAAIVALGATALASLIGSRDLRITRARGRTFDSPWGPILATLHPARVLRRPDERQHLVADLVYAGRLAGIARN